MSSNDSEEVFVLLLLVCVLAGSIAGAGVMSNSIRFEIKDFGATKLYGTKYKCQEVKK